MGEEIRTLNCLNGKPRIEFKNTFNEVYFRNNKAGGSKNLRCFPHCRYSGHVKSGFCGRAIDVRVYVPASTSESLLKSILIFGEIRPIESSPEEIRAYDITSPLLLSEVVDNAFHKDTPLGRFHLPSNSPIDNTSKTQYGISRDLIWRKTQSGQEKFVDVAFNKGTLWNYHWQGNRFKTDTKHAFVVTIMIPTESLRHEPELDAPDPSRQSMLYDIVAQARGDIFQIISSRRGLTLSSESNEAAATDSNSLPTDEISTSTSCSSSSSYSDQDAPRTQRKCSSCKCACNARSKLTSKKRRLGLPHLLPPNQAALSIPATLPMPPTDKRSKSSSEPVKVPPPLPFMRPPIFTYDALAPIQMIHRRNGPLPHENALLPEDGSTEWFMRCAAAVNAVDSSSDSDFPSYGDQHSLGLGLDESDLLDDDLIFDNDDEFGLALRDNAEILRQGEAARVRKALMMEEARRLTNFTTQLLREGYFKKPMPPGGFILPGQATATKLSGDFRPFERYV